jgi:hypothetical protein
MKERFSFLSDDAISESILVIPNEKSLLQQIVDSDTQGIEEINIFVPFFDDAFQAVSDFAKLFSVKINIFSPHKILKCTRKEELPANVSFYYSGNLDKSIFHAKFYEFKKKDGSIVFWGSANCSFSALISSQRNYEILVRTELKKEDIQSVWGDLDKNDPMKIEYGNVINKEEIDSAHHYRILSMGIENGVIDITLDVETSELGKNTILKGLNSKNEQFDLEILKMNENVISFKPCDGLVVCYLFFQDVTVSNMFYVNNTFALTNRILGQSNRKDVGSESSDLSENINYAFGYFDINKKGKQPKGATQKDLKRGFWRMPKFSNRDVAIGIMELDGFINTRLLKFKNIKDEDEKQDDDGQETDHPDNDAKTVHIEARIDKELTKLSKNIILLRKDKRLDEINSNRWIAGMDIINCFVLDYLSKLNEIKEIDRLTNMLYEVVKTGVWIETNLFKDDEDNLNRLELIHTIQNIYLVFSLYQYRWFKKFYMSGSNREEKEEYENLIREAAFFRCLSTVNDQASEHGLLSIEDFLIKLPHKKIAEVIFSEINRNCLSLPFEIITYENKIEKMLHIRDLDGQKMALETLFGEEKIFSKKAPLTQSLITSKVEI